MLKRIIASFVYLTFIFTNLLYASVFNVNELPMPGSMVNPSQAFSPLSLKGLVIDPNKPLQFQFILDTGSDVSWSGAQALRQSLKQEATKVVKYFLAGLTIPEGDLWVNLSPYEKDHITTPFLGQTELGRDLLAQDYILKQLTASFIYSEKELGKEFWHRVYTEAQKEFGTTNVPVNTFNKVWILPDEAQVFDHGPAVYITKATLKVMLDEDYLALAHSVIASNSECPVRGPSERSERSNLINSKKITSSPSALRNDTHSISSQIIRQIILPELTKEVNTGKNFALLRQIYDAMILAKWYKEKIANTLLDVLYTNKNKIVGVNLKDPFVKEQIYQRYIQAYKKGVFNYIKEDRDPENPIQRKYFSGGLTPMPQTLDRDGAMSAVKSQGAMMALTVITVPTSTPDSAMLTDFTLWRAPEFRVSNGLFKGIPDAEMFLKGKDLTGTRILLRANLNVTIEGRQVSPQDTVRLQEAVPLLKLLLDQGADVIMVGHNGRAKPKDSRKSIEATVQFFQTQFPGVAVKFYPKYFHDDGSAFLTPAVLIKDPTKKGPGSLSIAENIRLSDEEEPMNSQKRKAFGHLLTSLADVYIIDAFADIDSKGVTMEDLPGLFVDAGKFIFVGPAMVKESQRLAKAQENGVKVIISGAAKEEKLGPVQNIINSKQLATDGFILLGSSPSLRLENEREHPLSLHERVFKAIDYVGDHGDIGPETINLYLQKLDALNSGDTVLVQGILGWAENPEHPEYENGTKTIWLKLKALAQRGVNILFGGGSGMLYAIKYGLDKEPNVVLITAGGVTNKILAVRPLAGVTALNKALAKVQNNQNLAMLAKSKIFFSKLMRNVDTLLTMLGHEDPDIRDDALKALKKLGVTEEQILKGYVAALRSKNSNVRQQVASIILKLGGYEHADVLRRLMDRRPQGARGDLIQFLDQAIKYKEEGHDFKVVYRPSTERNVYFPKHTKVEMSRYEPRGELPIEIPAYFLKEGKPESLKIIRENPGGIDLNQIAIKQTGFIIKTQFDPAQLSSLQQGGFEGMTPVIVSIERLSSPWRLLGIHWPSKDLKP